MQVEVSDQVINDLDLLNEVLDQLLAFKTKHRISFNSYTKIINNDNVHEGLRETFKALFEITSSLIKFKRSITVVAENANNNDEVTVEKLHDVLSEKAIVIVENEHHDKEFINVLLASSKRGPNLNKLERTLWCIRGSGGCGGMPKLIEKCSEEQWGVSRILVVYDSDKFHRSYPVPQIQDKIQEKAIEFRADHVMLAKREIENYIPVSVLTKIFGQADSRVKIYSTWSQEQRDFFDLKSGFHSKCHFDDGRYNNLYGNLHSSHVESFKNVGFGEDIASQAFSEEYKAEFKSTKLALSDPSINQEFDNVKQKLLHIL